MKDYLFTKPRDWFQRSFFEDGPKPGKRIESAVLFACSHECMEKLNAKYPNDTKVEINLKVVK
ncbi:MAG: hypothetical protein GY841_15640 [FCB group bacterium]|nr:hypothetical protein [FCB group bacterium]